MFGETKVAVNQGGLGTNLYGGSCGGRRPRPTMTLHVVAGSASVADQVRQFLEDSWEVVSGLVHARCQRTLARFPAIDPDDVAQETLIQILRLDFAEKYDPQRGDILSYINGAADMRCRGAVTSWWQRQERTSRLDLTLERARSGDPVSETALNEFLDDLAAVCTALPPKELEALSFVIDRAEGSRPNDDRGTPSLYTAASRCRSRLRSLLQRHNLPD